MKIIIMSRHQEKQKMLYLILVIQDSHKRLISYRILIMNLEIIKVHHEKKYNQLSTNKYACLFQFTGFFFALQIGSGIVLYVASYIMFLFPARSLPPWRPSCVLLKVIKMKRWTFHCLQEAQIIRGCRLPCIMCPSSYSE